jgi:hypothetical protein
MAGVEFLAEPRDSSLFHSIQTSSGAHPDSYPITIKGALSSGVKLLGHGADKLSPHSTHVKNNGDILPLPHTSSWNDA